MALAQRPVTPPLCFGSDAADADADAPPVRASASTAVPPTRDALLASVSVVRDSRVVAGTAAPTLKAPPPRAADPDPDDDSLMARIARLAQTEVEPPLTFEPLK